MRVLVFGSRSWSTTPKGKRPTADETSKADFERVLLWNGGLVPGIKT